MTKLDLIAALEVIPGNPRVRFEYEDWCEGDYNETASFEIYTAGLNHLGEISLGNGHTDFPPKIYCRVPHDKHATRGVHETR